MWLALLTVIGLASYGTNRHIKLNNFINDHSDVSEIFRRCDCCDDGNVCTDDVCVFDGCWFNPKCSNTTCNNICFNGDDHHCSGVDGTCVGSFCKGSCDMTSDCPSIDSALGGTIPKFCFDHGCLYRDKVILPPFDPSAFTTPIHQEGVCDTELTRKFCLRRVDPSEILKGCLSVHPVCTILSDDPIQNPHRTTALKCIYFHTCLSEFRIGPILAINETFPFEWEA